MNEPAENNGGEKNEETYRYDSPVLDYTKDTIETVGVSLPENEEGYRSIVYAGKTCVKRKKDNAIVDERVVTFVILKDSLQYFAVHACEYSFSLNTQNWTWLLRCLFSILMIIQACF